MNDSFNRSSYENGTTDNTNSNTHNPRYLKNANMADDYSSFESSEYSADDAIPYSHDSQNRKYRKMRKSKRRRRILVICIVVILVVILGGIGAAFAYVASIDEHLQQGLAPETVDILEPTEAGDPFYMVLFGTDGSSDRERSEEYEGDAFRSDSIMLLRIDPQQKTVTVISLLRDTMVNLGEYGIQKLNTAYGIGGAGYAVQVISDLAGVPISHYAEIDFDGFKEVVDAIGGIEVDVPVEIDDDEAGGYLAPGWQTLDGEQALILCRSRHTYDSLGKGDEYRAANQRTVIAAIVKKILDLNDPFAIADAISTLSNYVTTDMSVQEILNLALNMRGMDTETGFYTATNPTESEYIDGIWWEVMDGTAWATMMSRVNQGLPPTEDSVVDDATGIVMSSNGGEVDENEASAATRVIRSGTVSIRNGTNIDGAAAAANEVISSMGYTTDTGNANGSNYEQTLVVYEEPDQAAYAQEICDALGIGIPIQNDDEYLFNTDFLVVIGADWPQSGLTDESQ